MHEWLEALQKSAKTTSPGVTAEELRRAETEAGEPLPGELGDLYSVFNGGQFEGDVVLYPLHGEGAQPSVLEKTRKMLVGLPVAGVWRFGLKGLHRHLYTARKSAMVEQGDGGGPLPEWVQALGDEDWIYGTWDEDKREMRFYRSLSNMLNVLVPPVEKEEYGERTFAKAIGAVLGALTDIAGTNEAAAKEEGEEEEGAEEETAEEAEVKELEYEYEEGATPKAPKAPKAEARPARTAPPPEQKLEQPAVTAAVRRVRGLKHSIPKKRDTGLEQPAVTAAERRIKSLKAEAAAKKAPAKKAAAAPAKKAAAKKAPAKKPAAPAKKAAAKKAPAVKKAAAKKAPAVKKAVAKKAAAKKAAAKKGSSPRRSR